MLVSRQSKSEENRFEYHSNISISFWAETLATGELKSIPVKTKKEGIAERGSLAEKCLIWLPFGSIGQVNWQPEEGGIRECWWNVLRSQQE